MVWMMLAVVGIPVKEQLGLSETEFGIFGGHAGALRLVGARAAGHLDRPLRRAHCVFVLMLLCVPAIFMTQYADQFWQFLLIGLVMGLAGGSFSVGTPYVARWFPKHQQGMAMGVFGVGNAGSAVNKFFGAGADCLRHLAFCAHRVCGDYAGHGDCVLVLLSYHDKSHLVSSSVTLREQLALLKDPGALRYSQYYSVVFGGYVALALWMTKYYVGEYGLTLQSAGFSGGLLFAARRRVARVWRLFVDKFGAYKVTWR